MTLHFIFGKATSHHPFTKYGYKSQELEKPTLQTPNQKNKNQFKYNLHTTPIELNFELKEYVVAF